MVGLKFRGSILLRDTVSFSLSFTLGIGEEAERFLRLFSAFSCLQTQDTDRNLPQVVAEVTVLPLHLIQGSQDQATTWELDFGIKKFRFGIALLEKLWYLFVLR